MVLARSSVFSSCGDSCCLIWTWVGGSRQRAQICKVYCILSINVMRVCPIQAVGFGFKSESKYDLGAANCRVSAKIMHQSWGFPVPTRGVWVQIKVRFGPETAIKSKCWPTLVLFVTTSVSGPSKQKKSHPTPSLLLLVCLLPHRPEHIAITRY